MVAVFDLQMNLYVKRENGRKEKERDKKWVKHSFARNQHS